MEPQIEKFLKGIFLLYAGRPEVFKNYTVPKKQRAVLNRCLPKEKNDQTLISIPLTKTVMDGSLAGDSVTTMRTHIRGWVYRVYRSERYYKRPEHVAMRQEGKLRTKLVAPCVINSENGD